MTKEEAVEVILAGEAWEECPGCRKTWHYTTGVNYEETKEKAEEGAVWALNSESVDEDIELSNGHMEISICKDCNGQSYVLKKDYGEAMGLLGLAQPPNPLERGFSMSMWLKLPP